MSPAELLAQLKLRPMERLRFRVLREFGILPSSREARRMSDGECLLYGAQLVLMMGGALEDFESSQSFDEEKFLKARREQDEWLQ